MRTIKFLKLKLMLVAAVLTIGVAMSFASRESEDAIVYEYDNSSTMEGAFGNPANWAVTTSSPSCLSIGQRPCRITVLAGSNLAAQIGGKTNAQVLAIHPTERKP